MHTVASEWAVKWHAVKHMKKKNGRTTRKRERDNATPTKERGEAGPTGFLKFINFMACQKKGMVAPRPGGRGEKKHPKARKTPPHKKKKPCSTTQKKEKGEGKQHSKEGRQGPPPQNINVPYFILMWFNLTLCN